MKEYLKSKFRIYFHRFLHYIAGHKVFSDALVKNNCFLEELNKIEQHKEILNNDLLLQKLQSCGHVVKFNGKIFISDPKSVAIGHNVHIGDNAYFSSAGGLTIGDNTHISRNVTIYTVNHNYHGKALPYDHTGLAKPVAIGKNVWIGMNVSIVPGVRIGDGAIIGMGTVVTQDVPSLAIVGNQYHRILKYRNAEHYQDLESKGSYGGVNGQFLVSEKPKSLINNRDNLFFVVTTGRSGSTTISGLLSQHSQITCLHESRPQLIRLSTELAHGEKTYEQIRDELFSIYCNSSHYPTEIYGESNQKLWNLIGILATLIPSSKFIWLIRDGRDVVTSTYGRRWFDLDIENVKGNPTSLNHIHRWLYYRLNGSKCGIFSETEWSQMSTFDKNCWYWSYLNSAIEKQLQQLPKSRWYKLKLEDMNGEIDSVLNFLSVRQELLTLTKMNSFKNHVQWYKNPKHWNQWNEAERTAFMKFCGKEMDAWYPNWRQSFLSHNSSEFVKTI